MIRFRALGITFALPLPALLMPLLAARLGLRADLPSVVIALSAHELAHLLAAYLARVTITEIRIMPFGGSAKMENPYRIPPGRLIAVAAAGPAANLLIAVLAAALAQWQRIPPDLAARTARANLTLMLFNLLPALPLDGGRILFALLERPLGEARALKLGLRLGCILACALLAAALALGLRTGKWNLTLILASVFLLGSEQDESAALIHSRAQRLEEALSGGGVRPARIYQLEASTRAQRALALLRPRECAWFVLTRDGAPIAVTDARSLLRHLIDGGSPDDPLSALPRTFPLRPGN